MNRLHKNTRKTHFYKYDNIKIATSQSQKKNENKKISIFETKFANEVYSGSQGTLYLISKC